MRLALVVSNAERLQAGGQRDSPLTGTDEIAEVDRAIHRITQAVQTRNTELSAAYKELERFSYSVSHDLRAPIRAIDSFSRRLDLKHAAALDGEGRRLLGIIISEAARMGHLIDDLLEFSRLGRQHMQSGSIDMSKLVREVVDLAIGAQDRPVSLTVGSLPDARGDRVLLRQVWENLIANALKYSSTRADPVIQISGSSDGVLATYRISDNGVGFDMKYAPRLFNVFERLHRANEFPGTGVGLAIVKRIVERHGGEVAVSAAPDAGATFSFTIPLKAAD
jgi:light-regulated signal transduction histidine kinase (bacteriophytochrome)